ncbi:hypothetical protein BCY86_02540 [Pajaroellobacter abortibovis]|uniref:Peptidase S1 domain-containing protein n=1 Tax=Pajaroellobacter abortibovis TaxID=1882918 RepID=A0A1L6MVX7_9BACT|nr:hypothetical protein BCY86_02540 [Pajaroellobacter abortibovis]
MVTLDVEGKQLCTGALIVVDRVLTSRFCLSRTVELVLTYPQEQSRGLGDRDPRAIHVFIGEDMANGKYVAHDKQIGAPAPSFMCGLDVTMLQLDRPVEGISPLKVLCSEVAINQCLRQTEVLLEGNVELTSNSYESTFA